MCQTCLFNKESTPHLYASLGGLTPSTGLLYQHFCSHYTPTSTWRKQLHGRSLQVKLGVGVFRALIQWQINCKPSGRGCIFHWRWSQWTKNLPTQEPEFYAPNWTLAPCRVRWRQASGCFSKMSIKHSAAWLRSLKRRKNGHLKKKKKHIALLGHLRNRSAKRTFY